MSIGTKPLASYSAADINIVNCSLAILLIAKEIFVSG